MQPPATTTVSTAQAASPVVTELYVEGMTCNNCARHVTEAIQSVPGVCSASVTLEAGRASVRWAAEAVPEPALLVGAIKRAGYVARPTPAAGPRILSPR